MVVDDFVVIIAVGFIAMLGIFHWRSSIQSSDRNGRIGTQRVRFAILAAVTFPLYPIKSARCQRRLRLLFLSQLKRS